MMGDGVIDLRASARMVETRAIAATARSRSFRPRTGGSATPTRCCASASSAIGRWCERHGPTLRRHHPRCRPQRADPAGLSRQGRAQDAGDRSPPGRGRRTSHAGRPAPSRLPAQHPRVLPARHHRDAVVRAISSSNGTARTTSSRSSTSRCSPRDGRALEWWTDIDAHDRLVRRLQPPRRRHAAALARRVRADRAATSWCPRAARRRCRRTSGARCSRRTAAGRRLLEVSALSPLEFVQQEFEHPTVKAGLLFFNGLREVDLRRAASAITSPRCWRARPRRRCRAAARAALARALEAAVRAVAATSG